MPRFLDTRYEDGRDNPFDHERNGECEEHGDQYYKGFTAGCMSADNSEEICESATDTQK